MISLPKINFNLAWLVPVATAVWAVMTWTLDHLQQREKERSRLAALYVNPFLLACEDLQSRIYSILELDGLSSLCRRYPDGSYAEETLFILFRFFGWMMVVERYGPYTHDQELARQLAAVRSAFATATSPRQVGPFNFFRTEQATLGMLVMTTRDMPQGSEFDTIPYYEFKKRLELLPPADNQSIKETIDALRNAKDANSLPGRDRLAEAQDHIVDLLVYMEEKERFTLFPGKRKKCRKLGRKTVVGHGRQQPIEADLAGLR